LHTQVIAGSTGGNLEGKEQRFGIAGSALFDVVTTVTSCGAVNSAIESFTGIGGAVPMANLSASEVIFGGVGTGLYSILLYVLLAVFIGGLMVGRTPEYLDKKIEAREVKLVAIGLLFARFAPILFALAVAGSLAGKRVCPPGLGRMRTDNATFVVMLIGVIILVGALTFFPALLLGPMVQGLTGHLYS